MLKIISERTPMEYIEYRIEFTNEDGGGFRFYADASGNVIIDNEAQRENYEYALAHPEKFPVQFNKLVKHVQHYMEPARGICKCGHQVSLQDEYMGACQCDQCGQWYNLFGQELLPPEYWND